MVGIRFSTIKQTQPHLSNALALGIGIQNFPEGAAVSVLSLLKIASPHNINRILIVNPS